jgi:hypothetical protein
MKFSWSLLKICGRASHQVLFITVAEVEPDALRSLLGRRPYPRPLQVAVMASFVLETYGMGMIYMILPCGKRCSVISVKRSPIWLGS